MKNTVGAAQTGMTVTKDTQIIYVNTTDKIGAEGDGDLSKSLAEKTGVGTYTLNIVAKATSGEADVVFVDVNNDLKVSDNVVTVNYVYAAISPNSSNAQLVFEVNGNYLSASEISALGITDEMISVTVDGTAVTPVKTDDNSKYPWNGNATCILPYTSWSSNSSDVTDFTTKYDADAGFMKIHVYDGTTNKFAGTNVVKITIAAKGNFTFASTAPGGYTVPNS